jgi:hypothetical protein
MLAEGAVLRLFDDPLPPAKIPRHPDSGRLRAAYELYQKLGSCGAAGKAMIPPISGVRLRRLLQLGATRGLFSDPAGRRRLVLEDDAVRLAILETGSVAAAAKQLAVQPRWLRVQFRAVALAAARDAREGQQRRDCIERYLALAQRLGRNPGMSIPTLGNALYQRIWRLWGSAGSFYADAGITPDLLGWAGKPAGKSRKKSRK